MGGHEFTYKENSNVHLRLNGTHFKNTHFGDEKLMCKSSDCLHLGLFGVCTGHALPLFIVSRAAFHCVWITTLPHFTHRDTLNCQSSCQAIQGPSQGSHPSSTSCLNVPKWFSNSTNYKTAILYTSLRIIHLVGDSAILSDLPIF